MSFRPDAFRLLETSGTRRKQPTRRHVGHYFKWWFYDPPVSGSPQRRRGSGVTARGPLRSQERKALAMTSPRLAWAYPSVRSPDTAVK